MANASFKLPLSICSIAKSFAFSYDLLADDLIEDEDKSPELKGDVAASSLERSRAGSGLVEGSGTVNVVGNSGVSLETGTLSPKLGVFVEIGIDDSLKLGGNLSLLFAGKVELEFNGCKFAIGGRAGNSALPGAGFTVGGINKGAGCNAELIGLGNEIGGTAGSELFRLAKEGTFALDANPFDGELLNMSKLLDLFPEVLAVIGDGPETSGMV